MAQGRKDYVQQFIISAVLNGGFSATFTKAQQEFIKLGAEIKNLQAIQRDVKAYEKQAAAVQNTTDKLENLRKQMESIERQKGFLQKQIEETQKAGQSTAELKGKLAELEREKLKLEQKIATASGALEKQNNTLNATKERLDAAGISTDNLAGKDEELKKKIEELTEEQKKAAEGAGNFKDKTVEAIDAVGGAIAAAGIAEAVQAFKDGFEECVRVAGDFGQDMSAVEAIASANASEMAALTAEAKELGATTKFTAQQSANAMEYMAMAGWNAQEMLGGMSGVINLAAAAGEDLAQVSDIVTDNLSAFGLQASDTAHFADVLAAAAANSNTNISIMGETFKSSSSVAGALGYSIEDVAVMVGLMANNAVKGSRAGTALRNIFNGLLGGVTLTAEAFGELDYSAVNSDGSMKGLMETAKDLRGYFDQMTESEKVMNAQNIAGMRGYNGLLAILNATNEDFQNLYASINSCSGAAERMAKMKLDNLNGDITIANSAMEALQSTIGEQFNPELRELTQLKTEILNGLNEFIKENPALVKGIMAGGGAFAAMGTSIVGVNAAIKIFKALNLATLFTGPAGVLLKVAGGIAAVTAAAVGMNEALRDGGPAARELTEAAREMGAAIEDAGNTCEETAASNQAAADVASFYIDKLEEMGDAAKLSGDEQKRYQSTLALLLQVMPSLSDCISTTTDKYGRATYTLETTTDALRKNTEEWKKNAQAQAYQEYLNSVMEKYNDVLLEAAENQIGLTKAQYDLDAATEKYCETEERLKVLYAEAEDAAASYNQKHVEQKTAVDFLSQEYYKLKEALVDIEHEMGFAEGAADNYEAAIEKDRDAIADAEEEMSFAEKAWKDLLKALGLYTDEEEDATAAAGPLQEALDGTMTKVQELANAYVGAYNEALESFQGQFGLFDEAKADAKATVEAAQTALNTQLSYWREYAGNIEVLKGKSADDLNVTKENYDALMEYVRNGTPEAAGLAADMVKAANDGNTQALTDLANTLGEIKENQNQAAQDVADWTTRLNEQMDQMIRDIEEDIGALDLSEEAEESGRATVQAYIDAADDMIQPVQNAYARVARAARRAMSNAVVASSDWDGSYYSIPGHAEGTNNAPPGWAWVGEAGPELMRMHGGEQILPSHVSQEVARTYRAYNKYSEEYAAARAIQGIQSSTRPALEVAAGGQTSGRAKMEMHFHIEAGASPETVNAWREYANSGELRETILEVIAEEEADIRRRTLA